MRVLLFITSILVIIAWVNTLPLGLCTHICPPKFKPVCSKDGSTYRNICIMKCRGRAFKYPGYCRPPGSSDHNQSSTTTTTTVKQ
ncbi:unnamed protein product [Leptidea sinapis]|uniref:Kazal-like domain-containing protein n=1 Tax=Leptidea sinapis TaxID=189913 RepID=A0A5E4PM24_9NEOP|nr:unnamed protein product [Leptidea sinapis]